MILLSIIFISLNLSPIDSNQFVHKGEKLLVIIEYNKKESYNKQFKKYHAISKIIEEFIRDNFPNNNLRYLISIHTSDIISNYPPLIRATEKNVSHDWDILVIYRKQFCLDELLSVIDFSCNNLMEIRNKQTVLSGDMFGSKSKVTIALTPEYITSIINSFKDRKEFKKYQKPRFCIE
jgi:hypothetical protein